MAAQADELIALIDFDDLKGERALNNIFAKARVQPKYVLHPVVEDLAPVMKAHKDIFIDTQGAQIMRDKIADLVASDLIIICSTLKDSDLNAAVKTRRMFFEEAKKAATDEPNCKFLFTYVNSKDAARFQDIYDDFTHRHGYDCFGTYIPYSDHVAKLSERGFTAYHDPMNPEAVMVSEAFDAVYAEMNA
jgi:cellulose biosynthesis protein BcsQ